MGVTVWRQRAPQAPLRQRIAGWRARNWQRVLCCWFLLTMAIMAVAAEPVTDLPKAQLSSVPPVWLALRIAAVFTAAGVPVVLAALP
jgi:hypothetical protein